VTFVLLGLCDGESDVRREEWPDMLINNVITTDCMSTYSHLDLALDGGGRTFLPLSSP